MKRRISTVLVLLCAFLLALCACSVAPRDKTVILARPKPAATAPAASPGGISFELEKASRIPAESFDQAGYFAPEVSLVYGWLDNDHLAAIGIKPVSQAASTPSPSEKQLPKAAPGVQPVSTKGLVGQLLSVDWQTGAATELHTVQDAAITSLGLSHDKSKLWYCSLGSEGMQKLSVSDISFRHDLLEVTDFTGSLPVWSVKDSLLGYFTNAKERYMLNIFDGTENNTYMSFFNGVQQSMLARQSLLGIFDSTGDVLFSQFTGGLTEMNIQSTRQIGKPIGKLVMNAQLPVSKTEKMIYSNNITLAGTDTVLYRSVGTDGYRLNVYDLPDNVKLGTYAGVVNFALSDDSKYICLVKETEENSTDIFVADWNNGKIENEKLVYKGFYATGSIYFSPDDTKLYVEGRNNLTDSFVSSMVLMFK